MIALMFPLSSLSSHSMSLRNNYFKENIAFIDHLAFLLVIHVNDKNMQTYYLNMTHKMIAVAYHSMDKRVIPSQLLDARGNRLFKLGEFERINAQTLFDTPHFYFTKKLIQKIKNDPNISRESKKELIDEILELSQKCTILQQFSWTVTPVVYLSSMMICVSLYMFHTFLDLFQFDRVTKPVSLMTYSMEFYMIYGWAKQVRLSYYPYGRNEEQYDLLLFMNRNIFVGGIILR
jgi:hypothetical protein